MSMKKLLKNIHTYFVIFATGYKNYTAYIHDILWINIVFIVRISVIIFLYKAIYQMSGTTSISGFTLEQLIRSLIFVQAIVLAKPRITEEIGSDIKSGKIWIFLLNPISYIRFKFFEHMPRFLYNLGITLVLWLWVGYLFIGSINTNLAWTLGGIALLVGWMMVAFFGYMMVGLLWFYTEETDSFRLIYSKFDLLFGGNILPIWFMPPWLQTVTFLSPFAYSGYTAGLLFVSFNTHKFVQYLGMQRLWIAIFVTICTLIYIHGKKKVTINWW